MADGRVVIAIELEDGSVVKGVADIDKQIKDLDPSAKKADSSIKNMVTSLGLVKLASVGFDILNKSLDAAISRFDTMESFPKVMESLGFSTEESAESVNKLADGIDGLPTRLDEVVSTTKRMASITGDLNKSTDATLALNNAMLASGASAADASRGMDQYIQMLSTGEVDLESWKTLQETMPIGLQKTAEAMGFVGETAQRDLYGALKEGEITFKEFQEQLIELGTGTGELAELARINSEGIATSFGNLKNATSKGLANIIKDFDNLSVAVTGKNIAQNLDGLKVAVNNTFLAIGKSIQGVTPLIIMSAKAFDMVVTAGKFLSPVLIGVAAGYAALKIIQGINSLIIGSHAALQMAALSGEALTIVLKAQTIATEAGTVATKAHTIAEMAKNGQITIGTALVGLLTGGITLNTVATTLATAATTAFSTALKVLTGPIGWVIGGITLLVGAATALWKWFNKDSEATKKLKKEQEELDYSTKQLNDSTKQASINRKEAISSIDSNAKANQDLVKSVSELADKEGKSAGEKKLLKEQVDQLNKSYAGLNLKYDEETGNLSMSTEALNKKIEAQKEQTKLTVGQEQLLEIAKQQAEVDLKLAETAELRKKYNEQLDGSWKEAHKAKGALKELDETEESLKETAKNLGEEHEIMSKIVSDASERAASSAQESAELQKITYESLSESQKQAVDRMGQSYDDLYVAATNAFSKINTESSVSLEEMRNNLQHNEEATRQWGENQAALLAWAGENGYNSFVPFIENMTISQAGELAEMAKGLDSSNVEQAALLQEIAQTYERMGGTTGEAYKKSMGDSLDNIPSEVIDEKIIKSATSKNAEIKSTFEDLGKNVGEGAKSGVDKSKSDYVDAVGDMAEEGNKEFQTGIDSHSPSKVFEGFGKNITAGLKLGIDGTKDVVINAISRLCDDLKRPFDNLQSEMQQIGVYAMQGLNNGLLSGASSVYATADNIAQNVKRTIQSAMDINSPSRWMKNFIGKNMMMGWSDGLEKYANLPVNALEKATNMVKLPVFKAEDLMGNTSRLSFAGATQSSSSTTNNYQSDFKGFMQGAIFNVRDDSDIDKIANELLRKQQIAEAQRGVRRIR